MASQPCPKGAQAGAATRIMKARAPAVTQVRDRKVVAALIFCWAGVGMLASSSGAPILGVDSDNGSEFINHHLLAWCENADHLRPVAPGNKNDGCHVEQKNRGHRPVRIVGATTATTPKQKCCCSTRSGTAVEADELLLPQQNLVSKVRGRQGDQEMRRATTRHRRGRPPKGRRPRQCASREHLHHHHPAPCWFRVFSASLRHWDSLEVGN